jgi:hypothetical protein
MVPQDGRGSYFGNLKLPPDPVAAVGLLKGKSNFARWHTAIQSVLLTKSSAFDLILGDWVEPRITASFTAVEQASFDEERRQWHAANTGTCRFIRETLATNVIPFVRQYNTAKILFFNLVWLYGEDAGIDTQGGPPSPVATGARRGRASLLAVLEAKRTLDHLPPLGVAYKFASPTTPTSFCTVSTVLSGSSSTSGTGHGSALKTLHPMTTTLADQASKQLPHLIHSLDRLQLTPDPNLTSIPEHEDPHPGRRVRISSGYAVGAPADTDRHDTRGSISPLTLSDAGSDYNVKVCL